MPVDMELAIILAFSFLTTVVVLVSVGGVILLRPISRYLGEFLEAKADFKKALGDRAPEEWDRLFTTLEGMPDRLAALEERQEFTEKLLAKPRDGETGG